MNKQIEVVKECGAKDIAFMLAATVALWGDGTVSKKEYGFFVEQLKLLDIENDLFNVGYADPGDKDLMAKEYILWLFETIDLLKGNLLESRSEADARKQTLSELVDLYQNMPTSSQEELLRFIKSMKSFGCEFDGEEEAMLDEIRNNYSAVETGCAMMLLIPLGIILMIFPGAVQWFEPEFTKSEAFWVGALMFAFPFVYYFYKIIKNTRARSRSELLKDIELYNG